MVRGSVDGVDRGSSRSCVGTGVGGTVKFESLFVFVPKISVFELLFVVDSKVGDGDGDKVILGSGVGVISGSSSTAT